jgi:predicted RND superfamily exporter protein
LPLAPEITRGTFADWLKRTLARVATASFRRPFVALAVALFAFAAATIGSSRLTLDPDIAELLPPSRESVQDLEALRTEFGGVGSVAVLVRGGTPEARRAFADALAPELERLPSMRYVEARRPTDFFEDRALYFLEKADLETVRDRLDARRRYEVERAQLDLDDEPPPKVDLSDIRRKYDAKLRDFTGGGPAGERRLYYEDGEKLAIFARPTELASNLAFAKRVVGDSEAVIARVNPARFHPALEVELTGRYKKRVDLQSVLGKDLAFTGSLSLSLVLLYVAFHFRRAVAVVLVMAPLLFGLLLAYGVAGFGFGVLNILTAFVGAILLGIGVDNGIHLLGRFDEARRGGASMERAVRESFADAGRVSVAAALTTAAAFGCLALSDFRAFREFGALIAAGMILVLGSYLTLMPAFIGVMARYAPGLLRPARTELSLPFVPRLLRSAAPLAAVLTALAIGISARAPSVHFDADLAALDRAELPSFKADAEVNQLLGRSQTPLVLLANSEAEAENAASQLRERMQKQGTRATVGEVATLAELVPEGQLEKREILRRIASTLARVDDKSLTPAERSDAERLERMANAEPFTRTDLPPAVLKPFESRTKGHDAHFVLAYPKVSMSDRTAVLELAAQVSELEVAPGVRRSPAGEAMLMADIIRIVEGDGPRIVLLTLALVLFTLRATAGSFAVALFAAFPALVTFAVTAGALALLRIDLNYLNMIMLPILLGIGVDDGMHVVTRVAEGDPLERVVRHTGFHIFGAILTDIFGFGVLSLAEHPGLASVGKVAIVGLTVNLITCVLLLPTLLALPWIRRLLRRDDAAPALPAADSGAFTHVPPAESR